MPTTLAYAVPLAEPALASPLPIDCATDFDESSHYEHLLLDPTASTGMTSRRSVPRPGSVRGYCADWKLQSTEWLSTSADLGGDGLGLGLLLAEALG